LPRLSSSPTAIEAEDGAVRLLTRGTETMDKDGIAAAKGTVIEEFFEYLLSDPYFNRKPPKSTGAEEFGVDVYLRDAFNNRRHHPFEDLIATVTAAVARSIVRAFNDFVRPYGVAHVIISGGGARNKTLVNLIAQGLLDITVRTSEYYGIPANMKEAVAFAILGNETVCGMPANVPRATGATHAVILGKITPGR
jgi:anhydro-N-acetylmuramic acid kinase